MTGSAFEACRYCDDYPCTCEAQAVNPRFLKGSVDQERLTGFNTALWALRVQTHGGPIRLDPTSGAFWEYDGGVWRESRDVVSLRLPLMTGKTFRHGDISHVATYLRAKLVKAGLVIHPDKPDTQYVSVPSGLFEVATGRVEPHNPDVLSTYQLQVEPEFDGKTEEFDQFLESVLHPDDHERVLDILSYLLVPGNPRQIAVMLCGSGRNGKSVLLRLVEAIVGEQYISTVGLQELGAQFAAAELYGRPLNIVGDIDGDHVRQTGRFKQMTGGDLVRMDVKHAQAFKGKVWAVPVFSANIIPTTADTSDAYLRRWVVVEFPNKFDGSDTELESRLHSELPAIAGLLLRHAADNLHRIRSSDSGDRAHAVLAQRSDQIRSWLSETELDGFTEKKAAYEDYVRWAADGNGKALSRNNFYARAAAALGDPPKRNGVYGWVLGAKSCPQNDQSCPLIAESCPLSCPQVRVTYQRKHPPGGKKGNFFQNGLGYGRSPRPPRATARGHSHGA